MKPKLTILFLLASLMSFGQTEIQNPLGTDALKMANVIKDNTIPLLLGLAPNGAVKSVDKPLIGFSSITQITQVITVPAICDWDTWSIDVFYQGAVKGMGIVMNCEGTPSGSGAVIIWQANCDVTNYIHCIFTNVSNHQSCSSTKTYHFYIFK